MKSYNVLLKTCYTICNVLIFIFLSSHTLAKDVTKDSTNTRLGILPEDFTYQKVQDSILTYIFNDANDSIPLQMTHLYQDDELRDTLQYKLLYDSIDNIWKKSEKTVMQYNNDDEVISQKTYEWNETLQQWVNHKWSRRVRSNTLQVTAEYTWNPIVEKWIGDRIDSTVYNKGIEKLSFSANDVDQDNVWIPSYQHEYVYKFYKDSTETIRDYLIYRSQEQAFEHYTRTISITNDQNKLIRRINYREDEDSLKLDRLSRFEYNNDNQTTKSEYFDYDHETQSWVPDRKHEYAYNFKGDRTMFIRYNYSESLQKLIPDHKIEYAYGVHGRTQSITYDWNQGTETWDPETKSVTTYNDDGQDIEHLSSVWDQQNLEWVPDTRVHIQYDDYGYVILRSKEQYLEEEEEWLEIERDENEYVMVGDRIVYYTYYRYEWNETENELTGKSGSIVSYNDQGNLNGQIVFLWDAGTGDWKKYYGSAYYYSGNPEISSDTVIVTDTVLVTDTVEVSDTVLINDTTNKPTDIHVGNKKQNEVLIYPNPIKDYFNVSLPEWENTRLEIWTSGGRMIMQESLLQQTQRVDVHHLERGVYWTLIYTENEKPVVKRLLKE